MKPLSLLTVILVALASVPAKAADQPAGQSGRLSDASDVLAEFDIAKDGDLILVPVKCKGRTYQFAIDTGAAHTIYDVSLKPLLGQPAASIESSGEKPTRLDLYKAPDASLGPISLGQIGLVATFNLSGLRQATGQEFYGLVGLDVLASYVMRVDFDHGKLQFLKRGAPRPTGAEIIGLEKMDVWYGIRARVTGLDESPAFEVDTGAASGVSLKSDLLARLIASKNAQAGRQTKSMLVSGTVESRTARLCGSLKVGSFKHAHILVDSDSKNRLGLDYLSRYVVTFDFPHARLYLCKGRRFARTQGDQHWGISALHISGEWKVVGVDSDGIGATAGIRAGDALLQVGNKRVDALTHNQIGSLLDRAGKEFPVRIQRGKQVLEVTLKRTDHALLQSPRDSPRPPQGRKRPDLDKRRR